MVTVDPMQEGKVLKDSDAGKVFTAISSLRLTEVLRDDSSLKFNMSYVCKLSDGTTYNLFLADKDGKIFVTCNAIYMRVMPTMPKGSATKEELKQIEADYLSRDKAVKFSQKHRGWVYRLATNTGSNLTKPLGKLFEEPKKPELKPEMPFLK